MQHAEEANQSNGSEGSPMPTKANSDKSLKNWNGDDRAALTGLRVLPFAINLPSRAKCEAHMRKAVLTRGNGIYQEVPGESNLVEVEAIGSESQSKGLGRGGNRSKIQAGFITEPCEEGMVALG